MKSLLKFMFVLALALPLHAQDTSKSSQDTTKKDLITPETAYKLTFVVYETEEGKRINQREYTMITRTLGPASSLKIGTRVPVTVKERETQYIDVGMDVRCLLREPTPGKLHAQVDISISSFALPDQGPNTSAGSLPVLRNTNMSVDPALTPGKAAMIASIDDVNSKKRMQVEVTAAKFE